MTVGEHLPPDGALVAAQAEIIRLTQRVAAAEAETVSAENSRAAIHKTNETTAKNFHAVSFQLYRANADLNAERRSHELTRGLLQLQPLLRQSLHCCGAQCPAAGRQCGPERGAAQPCSLAPC